MGLEGVVLVDLLTLPRRRCTCNRRSHRRSDRKAMRSFARMPSSSQESLLLSASPPSSSDGSASRSSRSLDESSMLLAFAFSVLRIFWLHSLKQARESSLLLLGDVLDA